MYNLFGELGKVSSEMQKLEKIKELINSLEPINRNTLKFCIEFFRELISYESYNKMTSYNIAVTLGPHILRPKSIK